MQEEALTTGVDDLIELLQTKGKISLHEAAKSLKVPETTLQLWVDFLVEERVLGVEYKFTKAYVYISDSKSAEDLLKQNVDRDFEYYRREFFTKLQGVPPEQAQTLWSNEVNKILLKLAPYFAQEVVKRKLPQAERLLDIYKKRLAMM